MFLDIDLEYVWFDLMGEARKWEVSGTGYIHGE